MHNVAMKWGCLTFAAYVASATATCEVLYLDKTKDGPGVLHYDMQKNPPPDDPTSQDHAMLRNYLRVINNTEISNPLGRQVDYLVLMKNNTSGGFTFKMNNDSIIHSNTSAGAPNITTGLDHDFWVIRTGDYDAEFDHMFVHIADQLNSCVIATLYVRYCASGCDASTTTTFPTLPPNPGQDSKCSSPDRSKEEKAHDQAVGALVSRAIAVSVISVGVSLCAPRDTKLNVL